MKQKLFSCQWTNSGLGIGEIRELRGESVVADSPRIDDLQRDWLGEWRAMITAPSAEVALDLAERQGLNLWLTEHFKTDGPHGREDEICA